MQIHITPVESFDALGIAWRALEAQAPGLEAQLNFFQSWSWVGCLAEERYPDAVLLRAETAGRTVGLALFNRRGGRLCLAESGDSGLDAPFIEHNAPLVVAGISKGMLVAQALLRAAWTVPGTRRLVLSGVAPAIMHAAGGTAFRLHERQAPFLDLSSLRGAGGDHLALCSANTRQQIRRSDRRYAAQGELRLDCAADAAQALAWFDALMALHARTWQDRGKPGAFATPFLQRFHRRLIGDGVARGEVELLRVSAGDADIGYLYNFRLGGRVYAYQSGLDHAHAGQHGKPGLTSHALAIRRALAAGDAVYDFMGGADRYKVSLSNGTTPLLWGELVRPWSPLGMAARLRRSFQERSCQGRRTDSAD